jgi:hypothetical protein
VIDDYSGVRKIIFNENDSRAMFSSRFTVNKNRQESITPSNFLMFHIFLPIKNMRNNLAFYANMRLLTYRFLLLLSLKYTLQKYNRLYYNLKDKIQEFMLCLNIT